LLVVISAHILIKFFRSNARGTTMKIDKLQAITLPFAEGGTTLSIGEEATTEAIGEENPTSPAAEDPASLFGQDSKRGGPFGAY
jgi:hypothetical protein